MPRPLARRRAVEERVVELLGAILDELRARPIAPSAAPSGATADATAVSPVPVAPTPRATAPAARLLSARDVSQRLACDARTVRRLSRLGEFPRPLRVGRGLRWRAAEVDEWLERRRPA